MNVFLQMIHDHEEASLFEALQINPELANTPDPVIGAMPLCYATRLKDRAAVVTLLRAGAEPNNVFEGRAALDIAAYHDAFACGEALLEFGADPNIRDEIGRTPLMTAAKFASLKMLGLLLSRGADVKFADQRGRTALHWATTGEHSDVDVIRVLLAAGAEKDRQNSDGLTAADYAQRMRLAALLNELK